jgi:hypothetical protein
MVLDEAPHLIVRQLPFQSWFSSRNRVLQPVLLFQEISRLFTDSGCEGDDHRDMRREETEGSCSLYNVIRVVEENGNSIVGCSDIGMDVVLVDVIWRESETRVDHWHDLGRLCPEIVNAAGSEEFGYRLSICGDFAEIDEGVHNCLCACGCCSLDNSS